MGIEPTRKGFAGLGTNAGKSFANNKLLFAEAFAGATLGQLCVERPFSGSKRTGPVRSGGRNVWLGGESRDRSPYRARGVRNRQGFTVTAWSGALEFHMTTQLRNDFKSKTTQYTHNLSCRKPLKPGQGRHPAQTLR